MSADDFFEGAISMTADTMAPFKIVKLFSTSKQFCNLDIQI